MKQFLAKSLMLFYLFSSYLSATHIHHDTDNKQDNCQVCILVKNILSGDVVPSVLLTDIFEHDFVLSCEPKTYIYHASKGFNSHAPPLFS